MSFIIRRVFPEDAYEYTAVHSACWLDAYTGIVSDEYLADMAATQDQRTKNIRRTLLDPGDNEFYCAVYEGKMIGRLIFNKCHDKDKSNAGEITAIYLLADFWDKGYGKQMMNFALDALKSLGYSEVVVWVLVNNTRALRFYEKCGFSYDRVKKEIDLGQPMIVVRLVLNTAK
jgi:ribosomal protein S18 acetylase RimI-like enzyme